MYQYFSVCTGSVYGYQFKMAVFIIYIFIQLLPFFLQDSRVFVFIFIA